MKRYTLFFVLCVCSGTLFSQNITTTLGTNGSFIIKDGANTFLTLNQSTGYLTLNSGVIFKGADRFIHNFGTNNIFLGINSGNFSMTGAGNTALGQSSLNNNTTGYYNTALGYLALFSNTIGKWNTALGYGSLYSNIGGSYNTALGYLSLQTNSSGSNNTALGYGSLYVNTTGDGNTAVGNYSLFSSTTAQLNTAVGYQSLYSNTTGAQNTAVGYQSLYSNTIGGANTAVGFSAGQNIVEGKFNTLLGESAGFQIAYGNNLTCIGYDAEPTFGNASDQITLGNNSITSLRCNVTTITSLSDARDKKNISNLSLGLDFLMKLKPRQFNWDKREWYENNKSDGSKMKEEPTAGFIAQELDEAQTTEKAEWLNLVLKDNPEKWEATPGNLLPIVVKAIQDLKKENDELKVSNKELKTANVELTGRLNKFEQMQNMLAAEIEKLKTNNNETTKVSLGEK